MPRVSIIMADYIIPSESHTAFNGVHNQERVQMYQTFLPAWGLDLGMKLFIHASCLYSSASIIQTPPGTEKFPVDHCLYNQICSDK